MRTKLPRSVLWLIGSYVVAATLVVRAASSEVSTFRIELGASDDAFLLGGGGAWGRAYRDKGPFRVRRGERRMTYFAARMAYRGASLASRLLPPMRSHCASACTATASQDSSMFSETVSG